MRGDFFDSNVLLYLASGDDPKADRAEELLVGGGTVSVQVLNEIAHVMRRKFRRDWPEVARFIATLRSLLDVRPVDASIHERGIALAERFRLSVFDG